MASRTRPFLMTGAALASAAAVVVATPTIVPTISAAPMTSASADYGLTTFSDVFTIPSGQWITSFFQGYGGIVGPNNPSPTDPTQSGGLEPWASICAGACYIAGVSGVAYLALDALVNGNGNGWADAANWNIGAVNYFFEAGVSGGVNWLAQSSLGAANPLISAVISILAQGSLIVTTVYRDGLSLIANTANTLPVVGPYIYGSINAYLGPLSQDPLFQGYTSGLSGALNYIVDALTGNAPNIPAGATATVAAAPAAASALAARSADAAPAPAAVEASEVKSGTVGVESAAAETGTAALSAGDNTAADVKPAQTATVSAADAVADSAPAPKAAAKRPIRDAIANVTKSITSALSGVKTGAASTDTADAGSGAAAPVDSAN